MRQGCNYRIAVFFLACILFAVMVSAVQSTEQSLSGSLTRGSRFTATITGLPNTAYYVWLPGTFTMTGEPYDRPPTLLDTANVAKDPDDGPYSIGSYQYNNGGGSTIRDDIAPSTANMSNTNYYARVTTDATGRAVVEFQTSAYTAIRSYSVKVENPQSVDSTNLLVELASYSRGGSLPLINTPAPTATVVRTTTMPTLTPSPVPTPEAILPTTTATPPNTPIPTRTTPLDVEIAVTAAGMAGICLTARKMRDR
jgi:hypothetical protein